MPVGYTNVCLDFALLQITKLICSIWLKINWLKISEKKSLPSFTTLVKTLYFCNEMTEFSRILRYYTHRQNLSMANALSYVLSLHICWIEFISEASSIMWSFNLYPNIVCLIFLRNSYVNTRFRIQLHDCPNTFPIKITTYLQIRLSS